jgi:hypothetical protein
LVVVTFTLLLGAAEAIWLFTSLEMVESEAGAAPAAGVALTAASGPGVAGTGAASFCATGGDCTAGASVAAGFGVGVVLATLFDVSELPVLDLLRVKAASDVAASELSLERRAIRRSAFVDLVGLVVSDVDAADSAGVTTGATVAAGAGVAGTAAVVAL